MIHPMQSTELTDYHANAYPDNSKSTTACLTVLFPTFRLGKAMQNDVLTTVYHFVKNQSNFINKVKSRS